MFWRILVHANEVCSGSPSCNNGEAAPLCRWQPSSIWSSDSLSKFQRSTEPLCDCEVMMSCKVAILGGGVGGLSAAHELIERGFAVSVFERNNVFGGKARSIY